MKKTVFLSVKGEDYSALDFEQNYNAQKEYEKMVKDGVTSRTFQTDEYDIEVKIHEFGEIDPAFISFLRDGFLDYDDCKHRDFVEVTEITKA